MLSFSTILKYILKSYSIGIICLFSSISSTKVCLGLWSPMTPCCAVTIKIHVYCYRTRGLPYLYQVLNLYIILEARQYRLMHYCLHSSESSNVTSSIICYDCNIYLDTLCTTPSILFFYCRHLTVRIIKKIVIHFIMICFITK
jgi:hypothetical protein